MVSTSNKTDKKTKPSIKEAGGIHGWLLKKAKTFMWDSATNTLILPKGVTLSIEERAALEEVLGAIKDEAAQIAERRQQQMAAMYQAGIRYKKDVVKGYHILLNGTYRELTGVLAHRIHTRLGNMLSVNNRFLNGVWKVISSIMQPTPQKNSKIPLSKKSSRGR